MADERLEGFRLSPQQRRLWCLMEASGPSPFRARAALRLAGPAEAIRAALAGAAARHEVLTTAFERLPGMALPVQIPGGTPGLLTGSRLAPVGPDEHLLEIDLPALCADARSLANLAGEIAGGDAPETLPYAQFAEWQNGLLEDEEAAEGRAFWEGQALSRVPPLALPFAAAGPGPFEPRRLAQPLTSQTLAAAAALGVPPEVFCLAVFQALLGRLTGRDELVSGHLTPGRGHELLEGAAGLFARALPVRTSCPPGLTFEELVRQVQAWTEQAADWAEHFDPGDSWFAAGFAWEERPARLERCEVCCERFDLLLTVVRRGESLSLEVVHDASRVQSEDAAYAGRLFANLLESAAAAPRAAVEDLEVLDAAERERLVRGWNRTRAEMPPRTLHRLFEEQVARDPGRVAVVFGSEELTYAELDARADRLARHLRALGVRPEVPVALLLERSPDLLVALWGVLKAGGAYLPLDLTYPAGRLAAILEESGAPLVITRERLAALLPEGPRRVLLDTGLIDSGPLDPGEDATPHNLAYVIYTSGTTGRPKGVMVRHRSVANLAEALAAAIYDRHAAGDRPLRVSLNAPLTFDASVKQWVQLLAGHTLVIVPEEDRPDAARLLDFVRRARIDVLDCTPTQLRGLLEAGLERGPAAVLVGGEAIDAATWERLRGLETAFYNVYGPTECTVDATVRPVADPGDRPVLGLPLANVRCHVLDARMRPAPLWVAGELFIGGVGVARGYLARPGLTVERFVPDPFARECGEPGARLYRTGDLVRRLPSGEIEFLGRRDHQVKIRGFRVELEEIEAALGEHPAVRQAAVVLRETGGGAQLAAYVAPRQGTGPDAGELKAWLRTRLPEFMVPGVVVTLADLPLTRGGKVDRAALPDPADLSAAQTRPAYLAPQSEAERTVAAVWQEVLGVEAVGVDDNFFDLGGHSLLMVRAHGRLQEAFGRPISMVDMFRFPTVGSFAAYLSEGAAETVSLDEVRDRAGRQREEQERQRAAMERLRRLR